MTDRDEELALKAIRSLSVGVGGSICGTSERKPQEIVADYIRQARREGELTILTEMKTLIEIARQHVQMLETPPRCSGMDPGACGGCEHETSHHFWKSIENYDARVGTLEQSEPEAK